MLDKFAAPSHIEIVVRNKRTACVIVQYHPPRNTAVLRSPFIAFDTQDITAGVQEKFSPIYA
jgi:hypothetical protein